MTKTTELEYKLRRTFSEKCLHLNDRLFLCDVVFNDFPLLSKDCEKYLFTISDEPFEGCAKHTFFISEEDICYYDGVFGNHDTYNTFKNFIEDMLWPADWTPLYIRLDSLPS